MQFKAQVLKIFFYFYFETRIMIHCICLNLVFVIELKSNMHSAGSRMQTTPSFKFCVEWPTHQSVWSTNITQSVCVAIIPSFIKLLRNIITYKNQHWLWSLKSCQVSHWVIYVLTFFSPIHILKNIKFNYKWYWCMYFHWWWGALFIASLLKHA